MPVKKEAYIAKYVVRSACKLENFLNRQHTDKFVDNFLTKEGETVEEAKERLAAEQKEREKAGRR